MEETEQNKSEQATPFKLTRARQKGVVARGMDLGFLAGLAAFVAYLWIAGPAVESQISLAATRALVGAPSVLGSPHEILHATGMLMSSVFRPIALMAATIFLAVLILELIQTGVAFSTTPLRPDFNRLNPAQNLKRLFSFRLLIETGKNVLKLVVYATITILVIGDARQDFATITDARSFGQAMSATALNLLLSFLAAAAAFAVMDQLIVRRDFAKKMRMSRRELRRETRDREGEPRMKQRRKQLHGEFAKLSQSLRNIRGADVLITNPTHFAVALKYASGAMAAPKVVAHGANQVALRLKRLAFLYGVAIVENRELARALYYKCPLNSEIPEALYQPVADVYMALRRQNASEKTRTAHA